MPLSKTNAIVIRSFNYGESDKIVTFLTEDFGRLKGIAKGARRSKKRFQNVFEPFSHIRLIFFEREGGGLVRVDSGDLLNSFPKIREDLRKTFFGYYYLELINEMAGERERNKEAFELLITFLRNLELMEPKKEHLRMFEIRMLSIFGYQPHMRRCDLCRKDWEELREMERIFFSIERGSLICEHCSKGLNNLISLSLGTARLIDQISNMKLSNIDRVKFTPSSLYESEEVLTKFISHQLGKEPKTLKILSKIWEEGKTLNQKVK